jgi:hypothetical protein
VKYIVFILLTLFTNIIFSQNYYPSYYDTLLTKGEFIFEGKGDLLSSSINNNLINKILYGGMIHKDEINNSLNKHKETNRIQLEVNSELEYRNYQIFPKSQWGLILKTGIYFSASSIYSKDFAKLSLLGNGSSLGETLNLSPTLLSTTTYSKLGIGAINKKTKNSFCLTLFEILNHTQGAIFNGSLHTNELGNNIEVKDLNYESNSYVKKRGIHNWGIGIDLDLKIPITTFFDKTITLQIITKNIGVGIISRQNQHLSIDSSYQYSGFQLDQLSTLSKLTGDYLIDTLSINKSTDYHLISMPGYLQAGKINLSSSTKKLQTYYGCRIYPNFAFIPFLYSGISYKINRYLNIGLSENYGITNQFRTGFFVQVTGKYLAFTIGSENIINTFRNEGKGQSFQFKLACNY